VEINKYLIEVSTVWKLGNSVLNTKMSVIARNINFVDEVPPEEPLFHDGARSRIQLPNGMTILCANEYKQLLESWSQALNESIL